MAEDLKGLIEKIQQEGFQAAEEQAKRIEEDAKKRAAAILEKAKSEAAKLIQQAEEKASKLEDTTNTALKQAGRDLIIGLKKEIASILDGIIKKSIGEALTPEALSEILTTLIKNYKGNDKKDIVISLNKEDLHKLEKGFLKRLQEEMKKGIVLKPSEEILAGFSISYDNGKSHFDFTDKSLAEYIGLYLKPKLSQILRD